MVFFSVFVIMNKHIIISAFVDYLHDVCVYTIRLLDEFEFSRIQLSITTPTSYHLPFTI